MSFTQDQLNFISEMNNMNNNELKDICKQLKVKQSRNGNSNKYIKRINLVEYYLNKTSDTFIDRKYYNHLVKWGEEK